MNSYFDNTGRKDVWTGGVRMIPISTPKGTFNVWTKRVGNNPAVKLLLLHGGPAATHEYFEAFDSFLPMAGVEYYYYDQLGSFYSDHPDDDSLYELPRFVEEVEQVRQALELDRDNFYLLGHSWGGILATEYALVYQQHLKGLVISNMMSSIPAYVEYANTVLMPAMDQQVLAEVKALEAKKDYKNPRYMELLDAGALREAHTPATRRRVARSGQPGVRASQRQDLHPHAGPERAQRIRQTGELGPQQGPRQDRRAHAGHRRRARLDGSEAHGVDVETVAEG